MTAEKFRGNAQGAIAKLKQEQKGEATAALHHKDVGDIGLVWGKKAQAELMAMAWQSY